MLLDFDRRHYVLIVLILFALRIIQRDLTALIFIVSLLLLKKEPGHFSKDPDKSRYLNSIAFGDSISADRGKVGPWQLLAYHVYDLLQFIALFDVLA
jgi:hypothetical protein